MIQPDIFITELSDNTTNTSKQLRQITIPWLPDEIDFQSNQTRFASYDILDKGTIKIPTGANIHSYSWKGVLPGEGHKNSPLQRGEWQNPLKIQSLWSHWREYGTPLRLLIIGTPVNHDVYLEDYDVTYTGAFGDYEYSVSFIEARDIAMKLSSFASTSFVGTPGILGKRARSKSEIINYTSVKGDTLWSIAQRFLGDGSRWEEIYEANQWIIETVVKNNGFPSSQHGQLLLPGTWLEFHSERVEKV